MVRDNSSVVKIDSELLKEVDEFIKKQENKYRFVNKKQKSWKPKPNR